MRSVTLLNRFVVLVFLFSVAAEAGYKDRGHFSQTFQRTRYFRVFTGTGFDSTGVKRYPVIYYCHGCMGTFQGDQYTSYSSSGGYNPPYCSTACVAPYTKPFNADFQEFANKHEVIVVTVDGNIPGASGCMVWVPYYVSSGWTGNEYRFGLYLRELFHVVDSIYPTKSEPQYRAISGLSMGGAASLWIAAQNQHLFRSMSTFCHSPSYVQIGGPNFTTIVDVTQLWRNFRGLSTRVTSNEGDYIYGMSWQLSHNLDGASVSHEYHRTTFDRHWAYHVDSQFVFHMNTFGETRNAPLCFSAANIYPSYDAWGWDITSAKADSGWIYLKDATRTGFGLVTRKWLPFGAAMPPFAISVKTAPLYNPNAAYTLTSYDYRSAAFAHSSVTSDATGRITVSTPGGMGAEYGIGGNGLAPAMALLTDTVMENIYIVSGRDTAISGTILNLSQQILSSVKVKTTSKSSLITVSRSEIAVPSIAAETAKKMDTLAVIKGTIDPSIVERTATAIDAVDKRVGFIKVGFTGGGVDTAKEHLIQVNIIDTIIDIDSTNIKVFDGSTQSLTVFKANRFGGRNYTESISINEGTGNGNGKIETGETFSLWFRLSEHLDPGSVGTWHPVVPVSGQNKPGIMYKGCRNYPLDITRNVLSAQMALTRTISVQQPFEVIFKAVIMKSYPATTYVRETEGRSYQKERYYRVRFPLSLSIGAEKKVTDNSNNSKITISPNPFNPAAVISFTLSGKEPKNANISVISAAGSCIRTFDQKELVLSGNGYHFSWDGKDSSGKAVSAGVYVIQITSEGKKLESKAVFVK